MPASMAPLPGLLLLLLAALAAVIPTHVTAYGRFYDADDQAADGYDDDGYGYDDGGEEYDAYLDDLYGGNRTSHGSASYGYGYDGYYDPPYG